VPFRAEQIGSLLRPRPLTQAFRLRNAGALGVSDYREIQDRSIRNAVAMQEQLGFDIVTDGEFRRGISAEPMVEALDGMASAAASFRYRNADGETQNIVGPHNVGVLRRRHGAFLDDYRFMTGITRRRIKITLPAPSMMHFWTRATAYPSDSAFFADLTAIYRDEIADLAALGCRYVQLDDTPLAMLCDPAIRERIAATGGDPDALAALYVDAINAAVASRPADMIAGLHLCRGNFKGQWLAEGDYESIAERVFGEAKVDLLLLEYDGARAGSFAPLRFLSKEKSAVLGLVSTKTPLMESVQGLAARVKEATRYVVLDRLAISPQCGFASAVSGNPLSLEHEKRKLALVVETARMVWG
jgi:5-methyltetrahydropteroyltriglutamate--homocysteine methyltransferase